MIKKIRLFLALLFLPKDHRVLAKAVIQLGNTLKQIADSTKVLEIARAVEEIKRKNAAQNEEVASREIH